MVEKFPEAMVGKLSEFWLLSFSMSKVRAARSEVIESVDRLSGDGLNEEQIRNAKSRNFSDRETLWFNL